VYNILSKEAKYLLAKFNFALGFEWSPFTAIELSIANRWVISSWIKSVNMFKKSNKFIR
jgi:hypothetical protein